ncbi:MAG: hypothetical protein A2W91_03170 [Bacteroidetes bacterium GWF2_38_335]|nr:MAG: hypothetical protein A2W91_03170 [Bacteroidetes bacterium GWF2_38_335]OFY77509.1 MAG: hypothetical protein A2281_01590 [Bacteroidetes bacterium RIFOXYA12_FULL_38_20]HBS87195.1 hypothetical protein [Bacteroidales bacterium]
MKSILSIILALIVLAGYSQNVGQKNDSIINYTDINGLKQGPWKKFYQGSDQIMYECRFLNNKPVGTYTRYWPNGNKKVEIKYDSKGVGRAKIYSESGSLGAQGNYIDQLRDSTWVFYLGDKKRGEESYSMGKYNGSQKIYNSEGILIDDMNFKMDKMDGTWKQYYVTGNLKFQISFENNVRNGEFILYDESGDIEKKGMYKNGLENGTWQYFDSGGHLKYLVVYENGKIIKDGGLQKEKDEALKKEKENEGKIQDPEKFTADPEEYFKNSRTDY